MRKYVWFLLIFLLGMLMGPDVFTISYQHVLSWIILAIVLYLMLTEPS